jgi:pyruvate,water dikinase
MARHAAARLTDLFQHFQKVLANNTALMERIAGLERALGGEYIFDNAFINQAASDLIRLVREVIYSLNMLTANRYAVLYDRLEAIAGPIGSIALGGPGAEEERLFIPGPELHRDLDYLAGGKAATLGEIGNHLKLPVPEGFALTTAAYFLFLAENGLLQKIDAIFAGTASPRERSCRITELLSVAPFPKPFRQAVTEGLARLHQGRGQHLPLAVRSSAVGEDGLRSFAGQFGSELNVKPEVESVLAACRKVMAARFSERVLDYAGDASPREIPMAIAVQEMIPARISGIIQSHAPWRGSERMLVTVVDGLAVRLADGSLTGHRFVIERQHPFTLVESEFAPEAIPGEGAQHFGDRGLRRGSSPISPALLRQLAEFAVLLEKALDGPQEIEWACVNETITLIQSRPLIAMTAPVPPPAEVAADLRQATVLLQGRGHAAQIGIASGPVIMAAPGDDPAAFPVGAIAVAREASPRLSPFARKAAAVITDLGGPTGHLAAICREYRTPALFGTREATRVLLEGAEITVDVEERTVYAGLVPGLLRLAAASQDPHALSAEAVTLRRLLRHVAPLSLTDPHSPEFTPGNCRTLHDLIRFCHEKAVDALINFQALAGTDLPPSPLMLAAPIPLRLRLLDLGGGLTADAPVSGEVTPAQVRSRPFSALLKGLLSEAAWEREPAPFSMKDLISSVTRPLADLLGETPFHGDNLAIIAESYCNLSLRLGYHFNVIDTYFSDRPEENTIYFRFVGGFAVEEKRRRRVELIASILTGLRFRVEQQGDLLVAKANLLEAWEMERTLVRVGELISFTRQLDVRMVDDSAIESAFERFLDLVTRKGQG